MEPYIFTADWHLAKYGNDKIVVETGLPEKLHYIRNTLYHMATYAKANGIKKIIVGGDIYHNKSTIYAIAQNVLLDFFRDFPDITFTVIDGNHDISGKGSDAITALKSIDNEPNVTRIIDKSYYDEDADILYVPYSDEMISIIKKSKSNTLVSHLGLNEAMLNSGISIVSGIGVKDLVGKYRRVLLGHYHLPQQYTTDQIEIWYPGSTIQLDWGEKGEEKRFLIVEENGITEVKTEGYKKHLVLEINSENKDEIISEAKQLIESGHDIKLNKTDSVDLDDIKSDFKIIESCETDVTNRGITTNMTMSEKLNKFLEIKEISEGRRDEYKLVATEIIAACSA